MQFFKKLHYFYSRFMKILLNFVGSFFSLGAYNCP